MMISCSLSAVWEGWALVQSWSQGIQTVKIHGIDLDGVEADAIDSTSDPVEGAHVGAEASEAIHATDE